MIWEGLAGEVTLPPLNSFKRENFLGKVNMSRIVKFLIAILVCQIVGAIGSLFTVPSIPTWYATIEKPGFTPPNWVFAPVWTTLFVLMGISAYLIWEKGLERKEVRIALSIFVIQLVLNLFWSFLFFQLQSPLYAFFEIIVLWFLILLTTINFFKISKVAGFLLVPYILWVSFAAILNFSIAKLNF